jgi:hypothetical protein
MRKQTEASLVGSVIRTQRKLAADGQLKPTPFNTHEIHRELTKSLEFESVESFLARGGSIKRKAK